MTLILRTRPGPVCPPAQSSTIDFSLCLGATVSEKLAARTKIKAPQGLDKKDEIVANVIWRFLELRGYVFPPYLSVTCRKAPAARNAKLELIRNRFLRAIFCDSIVS